MGNLLSVSNSENNSLVEYTADGLNRRLTKKVNGEFKYALLYQDALRPVAMLDQWNTVRATFVYGTLSNSPDLMILDGVTYRFIHDHLGSPLFVVNTSTGEIAQAMKYDSWGKVLLDTSPGFQPFGYAGGLYDSETGLVRFGARDYDPSIGRWLNKDPIRLDGGWNLYAYVNNNPVNFIDPTGLYWEYSQTSGDLLRVIHGERTPAGRGYSGNGDGLNNPSMQGTANTGPIPQGDWIIGAQQDNTTGSGRSFPASMRLTPDEGTDTLGRSGFVIHGDNSRGDQSASQGCIILPRNIRDIIGGSGDNMLRVVP
jgi:RHS repeat-associated protein